jgi:hypothetical protein
VSDALDDQTVAYVLATRPHFEQLRDAAAQLAGLLVLAASGVRSAAPDHPMLESAASLCRDSCEAVRTARATARARAHHRHLTQAAASIETAVSVAGAALRRSDLDAILVPLERGYTHLQRASNALPGFELVSFDHGCCGHGIGVGFDLHFSPKRHPSGAQEVQFEPDPKMS